MVFCEWHIATAENPEGTDCSAHLAEGRCFKCPFDTPEDILGAEYPCQDYHPLQRVQTLSRVSCIES